MTTLNTNGWYEAPFEVDGVQFVSKLDKAGDMYPRVMSQFTVEQFIGMNKVFIQTQIGNVLTMTRSEILEELARLNENATQALIELV